MLNFEELHEMAGRATPTNLMYYKMSLQLHKTFNLGILRTYWINLNLNTVLTSRQKHHITKKTNNYRVGMNVSVLMASAYMSMNVVHAGTLAYLA